MVEPLTSWWCKWNSLLSIENERGELTLECTLDPLKSLQKKIVIQVS